MMVAESSGLQMPKTKRYSCCLNYLFLINLFQTRHLSLAKESNCSQIFDLDIDEIGRQLFVSCAPTDPGDTAFIHVWKIDEDDDLEYVGKVVAGDRKSAATKSFPSPRKIAVFGRLK